MATKLEKLMFLIGVQDNASGPVSKLQKALRSTSRLSRQAFGQMTGGTLAAAGAGMALEQMVSPALDLNRALAEVSSLDVDPAGLKRLDATAKQYAMSYGGTAADFVRSSYDIQSGIAGLNAVELAGFTRAANVLAKATKADAATMTDYTATMYGIFKNQADMQGKASWIDDLAGKSAYAVQIFKTTGSKLSASFSALGANATSAGVGMEEQMAILGQLGATMNGEAAGTKYNAFLSGVYNAQETLGLSFTDSQGRILPMLDILNKLKGKFGDLGIAETGAHLKKAFGSDEAVKLIQLLSNDTKGLAANIDALKNTKGMERAEAMARKMVDPFHKLHGGITTVAAAWWQKLLPPVNDAVEVFNRFMGKVLWFIEKYPNITRVIGYGVLAFTAFTLVGGLFNMVIGASKLGLMGLLSPLRLISGVFKVLRFSILGCPLGWILLLIGLVAAAFIYWDDFKAAFGDTTWGQAIISVVQDICSWWERLTTAFSSGNWTGVFMEVINAVTAPLRTFLQLVGKALEWAGIIDSDASFYAMTQPITSPSANAEGGNAAQTIAALEAPRALNVPQGGYGNAITNATANTQNRNKTVNINTANFTLPNGASLEEFAEEFGVSIL